MQGLVAVIMMDIRWDKYSFIINGTRQVIRSGAMHYFRLPGHAMWLDRLTKLKAAGYNTVDLYFNWGFHSKQAGHYDFTGLRDIAHLLQLTQQLGLWVIARPGPYINAEVSGGGLPLWLLANPHVVPRHRDAHGNFEWNEPYMEAVTDWWGRIIPFINASPNVLMLQIENEYATSGMEPDYMQALAQLSRDLGVSVPLMHNDMYVAGLYEDLVDIYAFDHYPVTHFDGLSKGDGDSWRNHPEVFSVIDAVEENIRPFCQTRPLMVTELQAGWFAGWTGATYATIQESLGHQHLGLVTKSLLGQGLTAFNHYMAIGGTNWGSLGSTDVLSSYDFAAPINEAGQLTPHGHEATSLNRFLSAFDLTATDPCTLEELGLSLTDPDGCFYAVRHVVSQDSGLPNNAKSAWLFLRNLKPHACVVTLQHPDSTLSPLPATLEPLGMVILPINLALSSSANVVVLASTAPLLHQSAGQLWLNGSQTASIAVRLANGQTQQLTQQALAPDAYEQTELEGLTLHWLGQTAITRLNTTQPEDHAPLLPESTASSGPVVSPPRLTQWSFTPASPEIAGVGEFTPIGRLLSHDAHAGRADFDALGVHEGCGWYQAIVPASGANQPQVVSPQVISVDARHFWALYCNGVFVAEGQHWCDTPDDEGPQVVDVPLPSTVLNAHMPNTLLLWVDSLGHPKGFHDDANLPQGLLHLALNGQDIRGALAYSHGIALAPSSTPDALPEGLLAPNYDQSPIVLAQTAFVLAPAMASDEAPLALDITGLCLDFAPDRVNIIINNQMVGRSWVVARGQQPPQTRFYLPSGLLHGGLESINRLALVLIRHHKPFSVMDLALCPDHVTLQPY
jgi:hypothetical protein